MIGGVFERVPDSAQRDIRASTGGNENTAESIKFLNMLYNPPFYKKIFHQSRRLLAKYWLALQPALQIAITGSQGKTNTTQLIAQILRDNAPTIVTDVNLDTIYNVPITALKVRPWTKFAVFELGVDHPGEMDLHLEIVKPKIAIITGISPVHTDEEHLQSLENLIEEKRKLIEALPQDGYAILNWDDENVRKMASHTKTKVLFYGTDKKSCDVWINNIVVSLKGTTFTLHGQSILTAGVRVKIGLIGKHHAHNVMAAYLVCKIVGIPVNDFLNSLKSLKPLISRMSVESGPMDTIILNDALRANPTSTASGLETLSQISYKKGKKIAVLAEMGELQFPEVEHKKIGKLIGPLNIDYVIGIGPAQKFVIEEAEKSGKPKENLFWAKDVYEAAGFLKHILGVGDLIYLKGSLYRHVERVVHIFEGKKPPADLILEHY